MARAFRNLLSWLTLGALPVLLVTATIWSSVGDHFLFDFHGSIWEAGRDIAAGRNPYPPPTPQGVASGDQFVYPPIVAFVLLPLALLPFGWAGAVLVAVLLAAMSATLAVLGVRDWRCYGATFASIVVLHDIRLGALTPLLALGLALMWRYRDHPVAAWPFAGAVATKLFLWPMGVWLLATGRASTALRAAAITVAAVFASWAAIGWVGLADYPRLLSVLASEEQERGYSVVAAGMALGLDAEGARTLALTLGVALLALCWHSRARDLHAFVLALAAVLVLTPVLWLHYFALLTVPVAIRSPRFGPLWLVPMLFWVTPFEENFGDGWRIFYGLGVAALTLTLTVRGHDESAPPSEEDGALNGSLSGVSLSRSDLQGREVKQ